MFFICFIFGGLCFDVSSSSAQTVSLTELKPSKEYNNVLSQKVAGDSLSTSFVIWIKQEVKAHKHAKHAENIYVLEGTGTMKIAAQTISVKAGDYLFVPCNIIHSLKVTSATPMKVLSIQTPEFLGDDRIIVE